ncbi:MAG: flippase-like domain-containing protein [Deltaproteobacteria bacterium]|nr:flippase-like domain-containing protein [Deltaproteobacteria bacterium]
MKIKVWLGIGISAFFIWLTLREVDFSVLRVAIKKANHLYLIPTVIVILFQFYLRAVRWGYLMEPVKNIRQLSLFSATSIGYMANNILPARIGELAKAYAIAKKEKVSFSSSFATIIIERLLDLFSLFIIMLAVMYIITFPEGKSETESLIKKGTIGVFIVFTMMTAVIIFFKREKAFFKKMIFTIIKPLSLKLADKANHFLDSFSDALSVLGKEKHLGMILIYSAVIWLLSALPIYLLLLSFGYNLPFSISFFILVLIGIAVSIPSAPGFIGTFHFACAKGLELFNVPGEEAISVAIILHAINFFPITLIGFFFLWKDNLSLTEAVSVEEKAEEATT